MFFTKYLEKLSNIHKLLKILWDLHSIVDCNPISTNLTGFNPKKCFYPSHFNPVKYFGIDVNLDRKSFRKVLAKKNFSKNFSKRLKKIFVKFFSKKFSRKIFSDITYEKLIRKLFSKNFSSISDEKIFSRK
jgi:hypothetical protein